MTQISRIFLALLLAVFLPLQALAQAPAAPPTRSINSVPALKKFAQDSGSKITYIGRRHGIDVWMGLQDGIMQILYSTPDGQAMLTNGLLFGPDGNLATENMLIEFGEKNPDVLNKLAENITPQPSDIKPVGQNVDLINPQLANTTTVSDVAKPLKPSERLWQDLLSARLINFGKASAPIVFAFVDPRCGHCTDFWNKIAPVYVAKGQVNVKLIPVGLLGPESVDLAARLLAAKDPTQAWLDLKAGKSLGTGDVPPEGLVDVGQNGDLMTKWKINSTPFLVYRNQVGTVRLLRGSPENITTLLSDMGLIKPTTSVPQPVVTPAGTKN